MGDSDLVGRGRKEMVRSQIALQSNVLMKRKAGTGHRVLGLGQSPVPDRVPGDAPGGEDIATEAGR